MTASGSLSLILTLIALVVAVTGYAGGRLHQWWRTGHDRDEAYREGYDTATRSVFSLAARVIGPRRPSVRASAVVRGAPADDGGTTAPMPPTPVVDSPPVAPAPRAPSSPVPVRTNSASHFITDRPASPGDRDGDVVPLCFPVPDARLETVARPIRLSATLRDRAAQPASSHAAQPSSADAARPASSHAFRPVSSYASRPSSSHAAPDADDDGPDPAIPASDVESSGRHTVPDELVQAATYRLPADRVFRAKVPDRPVEALADDPTTRLPKPRTSAAG